MRTKALLAPLAAGAVLLAAATPSLAGEQPVVDITGGFECQVDGTYLVVWEVENLFEGPAEVTSAEVGGAIDPTPVTITPDPIPAGDTGTASIEVPGDTTGLLALLVTVDLGQFTGGGDGSVDLPGDCTPVDTSTSSSSTTAAPTTTASVAASSTVAPSTSTTAPARAAAAVAARPTFTG